MKKSLDTLFLVDYIPSRTNPTQEGTMCTAFPYCRFGVQRLLSMIYAIIFTGGFVAGPRALRPERLQWLTTSAVNRPAFMRTKLWSFCAARIARWALGRSIHEVDTVRSGALEDLPYKSINVAFLSWMLVILSSLSPLTVIPAKAGNPLSHRLNCPKRGASFRWHDERGAVCEGQLSFNFRWASAHFFTRILIGLEAWQGAFPPSFTKMESGVILR